MWTKTPNIFDLKASVKAQKFHYVMGIQFLNLQKVSQESPYPERGFRWKPIKMNSEAIFMRNSPSDTTCQVWKLDLKISQPSEIMFLFIVRKSAPLDKKYN